MPRRSRRRSGRAARVQRRIAGLRSGGRSSARCSRRPERGGGKCWRSSCQPGPRSDVAVRRVATAAERAGIAAAGMMAPHGSGANAVPAAPGGLSAGPTRRSVVLTVFAVGACFRTADHWKVYVSLYAKTVPTTLEAVIAPDKCR